MEYAQRGILFDYIRDTGKPFGEEMGQYLFQGILKGVEAIHASGFAHRDLKIENRFVLDIKKQHGCYEDYFRLYEEIRKIVERILN